MTNNPSANGISITLSNVCKSWGAHEVVSDVSFEVAAGTLTVLLGPSGCGKSSTLRMIAGLDEVTSGLIAFGGTDVTDRTPRARGVSMVFQSYALFPHLTVTENIIFGLRIRKVPLLEIENRTTATAELLGLTPYLDRMPSQLSGGQMQRVALARAIVAQVPVCLMDEPLSNLDAKLRQEMRQEIRAIQQKLGLTMIYVTHDQAEAMSMADQIVVMSNGRVLDLGDAETIYNVPANLTTARFIGTPPMNVITIDQHSKDQLDMVPADGMPQELCLGIRPEHIKLAQDGFPALITGVEYLGADTILSCELWTQPVLVRLQSRHGLRVGQTIGIRWGEAEAHLFDREAGRRIETVVNKKKGVRS